METEYSLNSIGDTKISAYKNSYTPPTIGIDEHWALNNLIMNDVLIDFSNIDMNFDTNLDLFPFGL
jgi:hypothetical protein